MSIATSPADLGCLRAVLTTPAAPVSADLDARRRGSREFRRSGVARDFADAAMFGDCHRRARLLHWLVSVMLSSRNGIGVLIKRDAGVQVEAPATPSRS
jgi:hypothetical protein